MHNFDDILARVTIHDILVDAGYVPHGSRMACPIHDGKNQYSFSFKEHVFYCFSCGAKGGLIDLIRYLHDCSKAEAIEKLSRIAGLEWNNNENIYQGHGNNAHLVRLKPAGYIDIELICSSLKYHLDLLMLLEQVYLVRLRIIRKSARDGHMPLVDFYTKEQILLQSLEELDPLIIKAKYLFNRCMKELYHVRRSGKYCQN